MNPFPKIGIISQARMTSTRLPGKILKTVLNKPLLAYHIERLQHSCIPIFIATTINKTDDPIAAFCKTHNIDFSRGDEQNVLSRFYECALKFELDVIVRVTSDCPLIDGNIIKEAVAKYQELENNKVYYSNCQERTFPRGFDFEIFSFNMLKEAYNKATTEAQKEHVTPYFYQNTPSEFKLHHYTSSENNSQFRITVDTPEDFELIEKLISDFDCAHKNAAAIIQILKQNPSLSLINQHIEQKKV